MVLTVPTRNRRGLLSRLPEPLKANVRIAFECLFDLGRIGCFSQFGEDAFLQGYFEAKAWRRQGSRLLSRPRLEKGFYVDVGAYAPKQYSNTYLFYRQGWCGINIDATPGSMRAFKLIRRRDANIEAAISCSDRELVFYYWGVPHVLNTLSASRAELWKKSLGKEPRQIRVSTVRLDAVLDQHVPGGQNISFLSVDTEGHELEVLQSNDWERYRPELVLVEGNEERFEHLLKSETTRYMHGVRYCLYSWIGPSAVYRNGDLANVESL